MTSTDKIRCAFIGLGSQGAPIATRMIGAGFQTTLWARRQETLEPFKGSGAVFASTIAELASHADHVGICVANDADVIEVCRELIPSLAPGARIAIHSTVNPKTVRQIAREAAEQGIDVIDAPVSGGDPAAHAGTLTVMLGGKAEAIATALPIFQSFGTLLPHLGEVGAGQNAKLVNNALLAANMAVADHALAAASALGIEKSALMELLIASSGRSFGLEVRGRMPAPQAFNHGGSLLFKDLHLLRDVIGNDPGAVGLWNTAEPFLVACASEAE
ncbi:6-phosphogluconate dehydrogenase [Sphingomonas sp. LH128]|uniref:NAD(P)-dependent oxidoreductase n=1 Tax=Sphingomonas sp. LH128 TaxID=473781 RepID=UPI00027CC759|nr:NAD(P)-dependent oxidoreductase [Sphingomonas sp. LH128]EJU13642.1 6-phosphogluconate dehydrogenase [Sphingomonas sp. LH128]